MTDKKANITLAVLTVMLVATWIWFFVSRNDAATPAPAVPAGTAIPK